MTGRGFPSTDPTPIFELFRGLHATELLVAAAAHFRIFERLAQGPIPDLQSQLGLESRPFLVLTTALRAMGLLQGESLTPLAREHLVPGAPFDVSGYLGLAAENPSVLGMVERLRTNRPFGAEPKHAEGTAFIFREGTASAMDREESARRLTLSLAGRANNVAPFLAANLDVGTARTLLDVGAGSGIYSYELLRQNPRLRAVLLDRAEVLKAAQDAAGPFAERIDWLAGDMFQTDWPKADVVLFSNILHDWDVAECRQLLSRAAAALRPGGQVVIHDVFLNDALDGPLPIALYSAALFSLTEGRAYSAAEYRGWLAEAGLTAGAVKATYIHCGLLCGSIAN